MSRARLQAWPRSIRSRIPRTTPAVRRVAGVLSLVLMAESALVLAQSGVVVAVDRPAAAAAAPAAARGPAEAKDEASAVLTARLQDRRIEVLSKRTADSTTWALPSGALQTEVFAGPVRVFKGGTWQTIDTELTDAGAKLTPRAAAADIAVSGGGDRQLASVTKGAVSFGLGWAESLPAPSVKGSTASYDLGDGQTLRATALAQGFSQVIDLAHAPDAQPSNAQPSNTQTPDKPLSYRMPLHLKGLTLSAAASGHLLLKDKAGKLVAEAPAPRMWDASKDPASGESAHVAPVDTKIETAADGAQTLVLTPDPEFLARTDLTWPVTVDPTTTLAVTTDTWVQNPDYPDSQISSQELKSGTYDAGSDVARSYLKFDVSQFTGKHVIDAVMSLYNYYSSTCATTGAATQARRITSTWSSSSITWGAQPATTTADMATNTGHWGYNSSCPATWSNWSMRSMVQSWAGGAANYGVQLRAATETDSTTWRRFRSANYTTAGYAPKLVVTYNSYATTASAAVSPSTVNAYNGYRYVTSLTPVFSAKVTDADGGSASAQFEISPDPAYNDTTYSYTATGTSVASGSTSTLTVPAANAFPAGSHLRYRTRGHDGTDYGAWSGYTTFILNTVLPAAPTVSCPEYPASTWSAKAGGAVSCTLDTTSTDGQGFRWGLDDASMAQRTDDTADGTGGDPLTISVTPGDGWHTLYARTIDSGGNLSTATTQYSFGVGSDGAALLAPRDGDRPARRVALAATGKSTYTGVTYQYRRGETDTWKTVPAADVSRNGDGSPVTAWPLAAPGGAPPALVWNITTSLAEDGPVDIRAAFTDGTTTGYSPSETVTVDREVGSAPVIGVGPGTVNALTGDLRIPATDAAVFGMGVSRTASSRAPTAGADADGQVAVFGSQWLSGTAAELAQSTWSYLRQTSATSVAVVGVDGLETGFTATSAGGWKAEPGAQNLTLTGTLTGSFTLKETDGVTTAFAKVDPAAATWQVSSVSLPTANSTTSVVSEKVVSGSETLARPKYVIAPTSAVAAGTCQSTPSAKGCRVLEFVYATSTTATSAALGDFTGRVKQIKVWTTAPGATAADATAVAGYAYDDAGRLRETWDPRISPALKTVYTYDGSGRVATLTPPGQLPWTFTYGRAGGAATAGDGMLLAASRPTLKPGSKTETDGADAVTSVVYDVPLTGTKAPYPMSATDVSAWGQGDVPTDATAVFPADAVPASHDGSSLTSAAYTRATVSYTDASGREVNSAEPGGHITTTEYDHLGNTVRELTAGNRELALATSGTGLQRLTRLGLNGSGTAERARQLSTEHVYSGDGQRKLEESGPLHLITLTGALQAGAGGTDLPAGSEVPARQHTVTAYDEGRPTDGTAAVADMPTTVTAGAYVDGYAADADTRTTRFGYDWSKGLPTSTTGDPDGLNLTKTTSYDSQGRVIRTTLPKSDGTDAGATVTTYYSATGTGPCDGRPEWADLACSTGPAGAITGGGSNPGQLPVKTIEYDRWGTIAKVTETANGVTRATTTGTDGAGRTTKVSVTGGSGTPVPDVTTTYDPDSGKVATTSSNGRTITHTTDLLGRELSYSDGAGNTATTAWDRLDRPATITDSAPSTTTFSYDTVIDPRGLETSRTDSVAGTFGARYDADANLTTQQLPGGYGLSTSRDETGQEYARVYTRDSDNTVVASDVTDHSVHGQPVTGSDTGGQTRTRDYGYDTTGRLVQADDTAPDGACTRRSYGFDKNSNRTTLATATGAPGAACTSTGATTVTNTYDSADRLVNQGTGYDAFGRTTTQASGAVIGYYANDLVQRQTTGSTRQTWALDPAGRLASWTTESTGDGGATWTQDSAKTNHYGCGCDSPTWIKEDGSGTVIRNVPGLGGGLDATTGATGDTVLQLTNIHRDVTVQLPLDAGKAPVALAYDEYGNATAQSARYGWLGGDQRSAETATGAVLMGVRLYDPSQGRFLSVDPVPGGNANAYDYCGGEPVSCTDVTGALSWSWWKRWWSPVWWIKFYLTKRETRWVAYGTGSALGFLSWVKDLPVIKSHKGLQIAILALRAYLWYFVVVSGYAVARGMCTTIIVGGTTSGWWIPPTIWPRRC
ncbi:DNRLRE domain-containing protein [Streptomyces sp. NPDC051940]|uniref:DNRLRE domain-containing protein n=1 Tax=Streptomyces sp. NPDC051940 TaxID=3155675 RepID=UPI00342119F2